MLIMDAPMVKWLSMVADAEKSIIKWNLSGTFGHLLEHKIAKMASYENAADAALVSVLKFLVRVQLYGNLIQFSQQIVQLDMKKKTFCQFLLWTNDLKKSWK